MFQASRTIKMAGWLVIAVAGVATADASEGRAIRLLQLLFSCEQHNCFL